MKLFAVLLAVSAMAFASGTFTGEISGSYRGYSATDAELTSYVYDESEQLSSIGASFGDYAVVDDYNGVAAEVDTYVTWGISTGAVPTELNFMVVADVMTSDTPVINAPYPVTLVDTGVTYGGYAIWETTMDLSATPVAVTPGIWLGPHRDSTVTWYPVAGSTVTGSEAYRTLAAGWAWEPLSTSIAAGDLFAVVEGIPTSLSRSTWAGIKNNF